MPCKLGDFEGTWEVIVGYRNGDELTVVKVDPRYELRQGGTVLCGDLVLDPIAFTLKSTQASGGQLCLSLRTDCGHLFGIEAEDGSYRVWGARKKAGGSNETVELHAQEPDWRIGEHWTVQATSGEAPVKPEDRLVINERPGVDVFEIAQNGDIYDNELVYISGNRTLDSSVRTVARWNRWSPKPCIFAMMQLAEPVVDAIREQFPDGPTEADLSEIENLLSAQGTGFLPFETEILARDLVAGGTGAGVWGAEEGGG